MNITGAIFDMDGTLIDSLGVWDDVLWRKFGERYLGDCGFLPNEKDEKAVRTMTLRQGMELIYEKYGIGESAEELLKFAEEIVEDFYSNSVEMKSGAREYLQYLKDMGVKICLATATDNHLVEVALKRCDIGKYFDHIVTCTEVGAGKDKPDVFLAALDKIGTNLETTWLFEDSLKALETAKAAGFKTVGIYDKNTSGQDLIKEISTIYISEGDSLKSLIP